ncbi:MAG: general stress protein, partial [Aeromicrobium sp.]|uniref:general stress protein n=1 Tax=Aeromicrobium sp. TaxID=1871063 RepID=UPI003C641670
MPEVFALEYPQSLGVFDHYADAQQAVDYLSDEEFPVHNVLIVGTDLKQVERVTGRLTWGRVLMAGAGSGAWLGLLIGLLLSVFT